MKKKIISNDMVYCKSSMKGARIFTRNALRVISTQKIEKPDYVISTFGDWGGHVLGLKLKEMYGENVFWVTDFRDSIGAFVSVKKYRKLCDDFSYNITMKSDFTTFISDSLNTDIVIAPQTEYVVAPIGFDYGDYEQIISDKRKLCLTYTGSLYAKGHSLLPLFHAISDLCNSGEIDKNKIIISYAGLYGRKILRELKQYGLEENLNDWGKVTRYQSIVIQDMSDILLTTVWNDENYKGVLGGKTLGYLPLNKPIIAIVNGNSANSDIKKVIKDGNAGFCYELANDGEDFALLKRYIVSCYNEKMETGKIVHQNKKDGIEKYNLERVANVYMNLLKSQTVNK